MRLSGSNPLVSIPPCSCGMGLAVNAASDGRTGPLVFDGNALDTSLAALNTHLQVRYANDDILAALDEVPAQDFVTVAVAVSETPLAGQPEPQGEFGPAITNGNSLDLHLVSFSDEVLSEGDALFVRIARAEAGTLPQFESIAADVRGTTSEIDGGVMNDPTLNGEMTRLSAGLREFDARAEKLSPAVRAVTGSSFDRYSASLMLLF